MLERSWLIHGWSWKCWLPWSQMSVFGKGQHLKPYKGISVSIWVFKALSNNVSHLWRKCKNTGSGCFQVESYFYGRQGPIKNFPILLIFLIWPYLGSPTFPWLKMSLNYTFCHSQNCHSECAVSDHLHFPHQQTKLSLCYLVAHVLVIGCGCRGHRLSDPFLPARVSFAPSLSCTSSAVSLSSASCLSPPPLSHGLCPDSTPISSLLFSHLSLSSLSLPLGTISSGLPQISSRVQRSRGGTSWRKTPWSAPE